jgi:hypothetical protein
MESNVSPRTTTTCDHFTLLSKQTFERGVRGGLSGKRHIKSGLETPTDSAEVWSGGERCCQLDSNKLDKHCMMASLLYRHIQSRHSADQTSFKLKPRPHTVPNTPNTHQPPPKYTLWNYIPSPIYTRSHSGDWFEMQSSYITSSSKIG